MGDSFFDVFFDPVLEHTPTRRIAEAANVLGLAPTRQPGSTNNLTVAPSGQVD